MILFISPAKGFYTKEEITQQYHLSESSPLTALPCFSTRSEEILSQLKEFSVEELSKLMKINSSIAEENYNRFANFSFEDGTPSIFSYKGLQYQAIDPFSFSREDLLFAEQHLRILSGLYGISTPLTLINPYRLEMMTKLSIHQHKNLYSFWGDSLYQHLKKESDGVILNLASDEYSKCIVPYIKQDWKQQETITYVTCTFQINKNGTWRAHSTSSKQARGEMVQKIIKQQIQDYHMLKDLSVQGFSYLEEKSTETSHFVELFFGRQ